MKAQRNLVFLFLIILNLGNALVSGNVAYRFGFNFGFGSASTSFNGTFTKTEGKPNAVDERITTETHPTSAPGLDTIWSQQAQLNADANEKLQAVKETLLQLRNEILHLEGQSSFIASKLNLMNRYKAKLVLENDNAAENRFKHLQDFVQLVDDLREPPSEEEGGKSSLDYTTMKLALEKHKVIELQTQILLETLQAMENWQNYNKTQLVYLTTV